MTYKSPAIEKLLGQYLHLNIGGKKVRCPYWMNILNPDPRTDKKKLQGPYGGKGRPEQIIEATLVAAKREGINLNELSPGQIKAFMKKNRIGVDCSGLVYWFLDALDREKGGNGLADDIPGVKGKFLTRANVEMLTNDEVSMPIKAINEAAVGDMIRVVAGKHIAIITGIKKDKGGTKELVYAHSSNLTETKGVHVGRILIKDSQKSLADQVWLEKTSKGENYGKKHFHLEEGDGVRRLKV